MDKALSNPTRTFRRSASLILAILAAISSAVVAQTPHLSVERYKNLGVAYLEESRPEDAARAFRRVIELPARGFGIREFGNRLPGKQSIQLRICGLATGAGKRVLPKTSMSCCLAPKYSLQWAIGRPLSPLPKKR